MTGEGWARVSSKLKRNGAMRVLLRSRVEILDFTVASQCQIRLYPTFYLFSKYPWIPRTSRENPKLISTNSCFYFPYLIWLIVAFYDSVHSGQFSNQGMFVAWGMMWMTDKTCFLRPIVCLQKPAFGPVLFRNFKTRGNISLVITLEKPPGTCFFA